MFKSRGNVNTARYSRTNRSMTKPKVRPEESATMSKEDSHTGLPASHTGYDLIEFIGRLVLNVLLRFWRLCSAALLMLFLFYWQFGGVMVFLLLCSALFGLMYNQQDALLYYPDQPESSRIYVMSPHHFGVPYENIFFKTRDGVRINGILLKQRPENVTRVPTIVMFHGNAGNIGH
ncbi:protein ABHD13-like, partial [Saccoglossus kowalevskii]|uniref:Alpha/beta hydrolase domain-containing protein 13-like n=1 Tax=Saccoglossus kowalevskii TaxID=10224 RepID=A0ABM0MW58_SACKO